MHRRKVTPSYPGLFVRVFRPDKKMYQELRKPLSSAGRVCHWSFMAMFLLCSRSRLFMAAACAPASDPFTASASNFFAILDIAARHGPRARLRRRSPFEASPVPCLHAFLSSLLATSPSRRTHRALQRKSGLFQPLTDGFIQIQKAACLELYFLLAHTVSVK